MIRATATRYAKVVTWGGQLVPDRNIPSEPAEIEIGVMGCDDPHDNKPYSFSDLQGGFYNVKLEDTESGETLDLVFARTMGEREPVAVLAADEHDAQARLRDLVLRSQTDITDEMSYGGQPLMTPAALRRVEAFVGAEEAQPAQDQPRVAFG